MMLCYYAPYTIFYHLLFLLSHSIGNCIDHGRMMGPKNKHKNNVHLKGTDTDRAELPVSLNCYCILSIVFCPLFSSSLRYLFSENQFYAQRTFTLRTNEWNWKSQSKSKANKKKHSTKKQSTGFKILKIYSQGIKSVVICVNRIYSEFITEWRKSAFRS